MQRGYHSGRPVQRAARAGGNAGYRLAATHAGDHLIEQRQPLLEGEGSGGALALDDAPVLIGGSRDYLGPAYVQADEYFAHAPHSMRPRPAWEESGDQCGHAKPTIRMIKLEYNRYLLYQPQPAKLRLCVVSRPADQSQTRLNQ